MRKELKEYNWGWWFVLSCIWLGCVMVIGLENKEHHIMSEGFFYLTLTTAVINLLGCIYIGGLPPKRDLSDENIEKAFRAEKRKELKREMTALDKLYEE